MFLRNDGKSSVLRIRSDSYTVCYKMFARKLFFFADIFMFAWIKAYLEGYTNFKNNHVIPRFHPILIKQMEENEMKHITMSHKPGDFENIITYFNHFF